MTFIVKRGSFAKSTAGAPVSQTIDSGSGEQIKFIRLWTERQVGVGFLDEDVGHSEGWSDGVNEGSVSIGIEDGVGTSNAARRQTALALSCVDPDQSLAYQGTITSFGSGIDAGKFTINWTTNNILADEIYYEVFCGNRIANVKIGTFASATVTGNQAITGVGFQPNYLNVWSIGRNGALPNTVADASYSIGDAVSASKRNAIAMYVDEGVVNTITTQTDLLIRTLEFAGMGGGATVLEDIDFVSFDADGWTQNLIVAHNQADIYGYLAVEFVDVEVDIGDFLQPTTNSTVNVPTVLDSVQAIKLRSQMRTGTGTIINDGIVKQMVGAGTYPNLDQATTGYFYDHNAANTDSENFGDKTKVAKMVSAQTTVDGSAELIAKTLASDFRLTWASVDAVQRELLFTAFSFDNQGFDFSCDAMLKIIVDEQFDVDAILFKTDEDTSQVDANILLTIDDDSLVDGIVINREAITFDVDAFLQTTNTDTSLVDAVIVERVDLDWTVDAITFFKDQEHEFTVDANVQLETSTSFSVDANTQGTLEETYLVDANIELTTFSQVTLDAVIVDRFTDDSDVDAIVINRETDTSLVDGIISSRLLEAFDVDSFIRLQKTTVFNVDAFVLMQEDFNFKVDGFLADGKSKFSTVDALVRELDKEHTFNVDAQIEQLRQITFLLDARLSSRLPQNFTVDAFLRDVNQIEFDVDAITKIIVEHDFTVDAILPTLTDLDWSNDAILTSTSAEEFTVDAILSGVLNYTVDAFTSQSKGGAYTADARLSSRRTTDFNVDGALAGPTEFEYTVDGITFATQDGEFNVDANIVGGTEHTFDVDSIISTIKTTDYTVDAFVLKETDFEFDLDSIVTADGFFFWSVDSCPLATLEHTFEVDANIPDNVEHNFNLDAVIVAQPPFNFDVDALIGGDVNGILFWAVDCIIQLDLTCAFPDEDISNAGLWSPTPLWKEIDTFQCDGNFVSRNGHPDPVDSFEVGLEPTGDPGVSDDHFITINARTNKANDHFKARGILKQSGVPIAYTPYFTLEVVFNRFVYELSASEADSITNYMTLSTEVQTEQFGRLDNGFDIDGVIV